MKDRKEICSGFFIRPCQTYHIGLQYVAWHLLPHLKNAQCTEIQSPSPKQHKYAFLDIEIVPADQATNLMHKQSKWYQRHIDHKGSTQ